MSGRTNVFLRPQLRGFNAGKCEWLPQLKLHIQPRLQSLYNTCIALNRSSLFSSRQCFADHLRILCQHRWHNNIFSVASLKTSCCLQQPTQRLFEIQQWGLLSKWDCDFLVDPWSRLSRPVADAIEHQMQVAGGRMCKLGKKPSFSPCHVHLRQKCMTKYISR